MVGSSKERSDFGKVIKMYAKKNFNVKKLLKILGIVIGSVLGLVILFFFFIMITEFKPEDRTAVDVEGDDAEFDKDYFDIVTLNTGYAGLNEDMDFFMDGGEGVNPKSKEQVQENIDGINNILDLFEPDFYFLQEVDKDSSRSYHIDETAAFKSSYNTRTYAQNYVCSWVPYPMPMIGAVDSGIMTLSKHKISSAERISLPNNISWPKSMFMLKRCMLVTRVPIKGSEKELVLVNFHLEAYDTDETKEQQNNIVMNLIKSEYEKGNYVVAGGDFNMNFPGMTKQLPYIEGDQIWRPGKLTLDMLPEGFSFAYDTSVPTCRALNKPFEGLTENQLYALDGFVYSPNLEVELVLAINCNFKFTDHNPVYMRIRFKDEGNS